MKCGGRAAIALEIPALVPQLSISSGAGLIDSAILTRQIAAHGAGPEINCIHEAEKWVQYACCCFSGNSKHHLDAGYNEMFHVELFGRQSV
jgi:hypothetical protein